MNHILSIPLFKVNNQNWSGICLSLRSYDLSNFYRKALRNQLS